MLCARAHVYMYTNCNNAGFYARKLDLVNKHTHIVLQSSKHRLAKSFWLKAAENSILQCTLLLHYVHDKKEYMVVILCQDYRVEIILLYGN